MFQERLRERLIDLAASFCGYSGLIAFIHSLSNLVALRYFTRALDDLDASVMSDSGSTTAVEM